MDQETKYRISLEDLFSKGLAGAEANALKFENVISSLKSSIASIGIGFGFSQIGKQIFEVGTNMDNLNISLKTMLGNKEAADALVSDMIKFSQTTPFQQDEVATAGKQLLAYGIEAKNIIPTLRQLGDVSAGLAQPIGEIAYLYGTIRTQGRAMTVDIRQFANRGIPIYEELAKVTGKSGAALQKFIEDGRVGFPEIQKAFENMSGSGGKFNNLMDELSKTTGGQFSNLKDQLQQLGVSIFREVQPALNWFIQASQKMIQFFKDNSESIKALSHALLDLGIALAVVKGAMLALDLVAALNPITAMIGLVVALAAAWYQADQAYKQYDESINKRVDDSIKEEINLVNQLTASLEKKGMAHDKAQQMAIAAERKNLESYIAEVKEEMSFYDDLKKQGTFDSTQHGEDYLILNQRLTRYMAQMNALNNVSKLSKTSSSTIPSTNDLGSGISDPKSSKVQNITINLNNPFQNMKITPANLNVALEDIAPKFTEFLVSLVKDSAIIATE